MQHFLGNARLLRILLVGIGMVGVDQAGRIDQVAFQVHLNKQFQIFIMIIGLIQTMLVDRAAQYGVCQRIAACPDGMALVGKHMALLRRADGVEPADEAARQPVQRIE